MIGDQNELERLDGLMERAAASARAYTWPPSLLERIPPDSAARTRLRHVRETYQRTQAVRYRTYQAHRAAGRDEDARAVAAEFAAARRELARFAEDFETDLSATFTERAARSAPTPAELAEPIRRAGRTLENASTGVGIGIGVAVAACLYFFKSSRR